MSFLHVERHEVLTRVVDMAQWMDLGLRGEEFLEMDELRVEAVDGSWKLRGLQLIDEKRIDPGAVPPSGSKQIEGG